MRLQAETALAPATAAAADPVWLSSYPAGVPASIDADAYPSLHAMLLEACRNYAERPAFECLRARMSYAEWERDSRDFAAFLLEEVNCQPGDRVAIMLPNMLAYPVTFLGTLRAGLTVVNFNPLYTPRELKEQLADSGAVVIVILENFAHKLETIIAETQIRHVVVARLGDFVPTLKRWAFNLANSYLKHAVPAWHFETFTMLQDACSRKPSEHYVDADAAGDRVGAAAIYRRNDRRGQRRDAEPPQYDRQHAAMLLAWIGSGLKLENERVLTPLPLYHIFSLTANLLVFARFGGMNILIPDPRDLHRLIRTMRSAGITAMSGVNTLFNALINHPELRRPGLQHAARDHRRRRGGAERSRPPLARHHRQRAGRRLRPDRSVAGGVHQSDPGAKDRDRRPAGALDRGDHPRR